MHFGDVCDSASMIRLISELEPDEIYNLAAQSHVAVSFELPEYTADVTGTGALRLFEAVRISGVKAKVYQASSSEMFGASPAPQSETTRFRPCSPYGAAKVFAHHSAQVYRDAYNMHISCGILFNHESPRRGETFLTRKVAMAIAKIKSGEMKQLTLGRPDAKRDFGYAPEYCDAMWRMLQLDRPVDLVIGTGESHSIEEFVREAFAYAGLECRDHVVKLTSHFRPLEVMSLRADARLARQVIGWEPKTDLGRLIRIMIDHELKAVPQSREACA
jgi:GDPmannose 4,6-dehydratase